MKTKGNFKEVPIGHEIKFGSYIGVKIDATHVEVQYPLKENEVIYFSSSRWVEYNPVYPQLNRTDTKIRG